MTEDELLTEHTLRGEEIARLQAEIEGLTAEIERLRSLDSVVVQKLVNDEMERLRANDELAIAMKRIDRLEAENVRLRALLMWLNCKAELKYDEHEKIHRELECGT